MLGAAVDGQRHVRADLLGQHVGGDDGIGVAAREDHQPLDVVPELAHVAGPVVRLQHGNGVLADLARCQPRGLGNLADEKLDQHRDVLAALGQAWHAQWHDVEAVVEVLAETALRHLPLQVATGRGDDAHVDRDLGAAADALELLLHQDAQDLALRLQRHVGHLVDVERAAMRLLERTDLARSRVILGAEQLLLDPVGGHGGGVEHHEGRLLALREAVHHAGNQLLAGAAAAADQHAAVGGRHAVERGAQLVHGRRLADHLEADDGALLELAHLALQLGGLERAQRDEQQPVGLERLLDVVVGAALDGGDRGLDVAVAGDDDDRQVGVRLLDDVEHLQAVEAAALQPDVQDDELRAPLLHRLQRLIRIAGKTRAVAVVLQEPGDHLPDVRLVVDDQDVGCHLSLLHTLAIMRRCRRRRLQALHALPFGPAPGAPAAKCG